MANSKFMGQVSAVSNTGLNFAAQGVGQKASAPKSTSPVHNRGLTLGGKQHLTGGSGHTVSPKQVAAIADKGSPKAPANHPAVAKNSGKKPSINFG